MTDLGILQIYLGRYKFKTKATVGNKHIAKNKRLKKSPTNY